MHPLETIFARRETTVLIPTGKILLVIFPFFSGLHKWPFICSPYLQWNYHDFKISRLVLVKSISCLNYAFQMKMDFQGMSHKCCMYVRVCACMFMCVCFFCYVPKYFVPCLHFFLSQTFTCFKLVSIMINVSWNMLCSIW